MKKIIILSGAYGYHPEGKKCVKPIYRGETVVVPDDEAERLVLRGAAEVVCDMCEENAFEAVATPADSVVPGVTGANTPEAENGAEGEETPRLDPEQLKELSNAKLKELAEDMGIDCAKLRTKAQLIAAITDIPLEDANEAEAEDEQPPVLDAEAPVT